MNNKRIRNPNTFGWLKLQVNHLPLFSNIGTSRINFPDFPRAVDNRNEPASVDGDQAVVGPMVAGQFHPETARTN